MTGEDPDPALTIDHINENPGDNRWCNLRQVSKSKNIYRSSKFKRVPCLTAQKRGDKWQAVAREQNTIEGVRTVKCRHLGMFDTREEALAADINKPPPPPDNKPRVRRTKSGRWEARVRIGPGKRAHLGTFDTKEQALNAKNQFN